MKIVQAFKKLFGKILFVRLLELEGRVIEEARQIVREVLEDHVAVILLDHDFAKLNNVAMIERLQELDLSYSSNRKAVALAFHSNLLQSDHVLCVDVNALEHFTIGTRSYNRFVTRLAVVNR